MTEHPQIEYQVLKAYIRNQSKDDDVEQIQKLRKKDLAIDYLIQMIDTAKKKTLNFNEIGDLDISQNLTSSDELLLRYLSGSFSTNDSVELTSALLKSNRFYNQLIESLTFATSDFSNEKFVAKNQIIVKADAEFLNKIIKKSIIGRDHIKFLSGKLQNLMHAIRDFFSKPFNMRLGFVLSTACIILLVLVTFQNKKSGNEYIYDDQIPFIPTVFRSVEPTPTSSETEFLNDGLRGMFMDYVDRNYISVVNTFEHMRPSVDSARVTIQDKDSGCILRDMYFYSGISNFSIFRSKQLDLQRASRQSYLQTATHDLEIALQLAGKNQCSSLIDREFYFLALAYGFGASYSKALNALNQIEPESNYFDDSIKLKKRWSNLR